MYITLYTYLMFTEEIRMLHCGSDITKTLDKWFLYVCVCGVCGVCCVRAGLVTKGNIASICQMPFYMHVHIHVHAGTCRCTCRM